MHVWNGRIQETNQSSKWNLKWNLKQNILLNGEIDVNYKLINSLRESKAEEEDTDEIEEIRDDGTEPKKSNDEDKAILTINLSVISATLIQR